MAKSHSCMLVGSNGHQDSVGMDNENVHLRDLAAGRLYKCYVGYGNWSLHIYLAM